MPDVVEVSERLLRNSLERGLSEVEVYAVRTLMKTLTVADDRVLEGAVREDYDIGVRGALGRRVGSVSTNVLSLDVGRLVDKLYASARSSPEDPYWSGFPTDVGGLNQVACYDESTAGISEEELADLLSHVAGKLKEPALARGVDRATIAGGMVASGEVEVFIANSHGVSKSVRCSGAMMWLTLSLKRGGAHSDKTLSYIRRRVDLKEIEAVSIREGERALMFFNSSPIESGKYDVILTPSVAGQILMSVLAPAFSALNILEGRSPLKGRLGDRVLNEKITVVDDPSIEVAVGSRPFDDEGIATRTKNVIEKGVFKTMLHSYYTSRRMGSEPTGNGLRQRPASQPVPSFTNLVVRPGKGSSDSFAEDVKKGLVVYEVIGSWMSDPATGRLKATITHGMLVEGGKPVKPVKGVILGGNVYRLLSESLQGVGGDLEIVDYTVTPSLWIGSADIAGR
jgi:PmbA protein